MQKHSQGQLLCVPVRFAEEELNFQAKQQI